MSWSEQNLQFLATLGSALALYIFVRVGAVRDAKAIKNELEKEIKGVSNNLDAAKISFSKENQEIKTSLGKEIQEFKASLGKEIQEVKTSLGKEIQEVKEELKEIRIDLKSIDQRLTRLEGRFEERGYWESQIKLIKDKDAKEK